MTIRHPVTVESDLMTVISRWTDLSWKELEDREVIWFMLQGVRPISMRGPWDGPVLRWTCERPCQCSRCLRGERTRAYLCEYAYTCNRGGSSVAKQAVRQHLRDVHDKVQPLTRVVDRIGGPVIRTER